LLVEGNRQDILFGLRAMSKTGPALSAESIVRSASDELVLIDKFVGDELTADLAFLLKKNGNIKRLTLRGNCIGPQGAQALASMLEENTCLESVSLEWNQMGNAGALAMANALTKNHTLRSIDFRNNNIADEGAIALATSMRLNTVVTSIDLRWNVIGDKGGLPFEDIIARVNTPVTVLLSGNVISAQAMARLEGISERRVELEEMQNYDIIGEADAHVARRKGVLLEQDVTDLHQHLDLAKLQREELQRQLNASAVQITDLEQQVLREQFKNRQLDEDLGQTRRRMADMIDENRVSTAGWETERRDFTEEMKQIVREKEIEIRSLITERDALTERTKKAEEEVYRKNFQMEQNGKRFEQQKADLLKEIRASLDKTTELSTGNAALEHENKYLQELSNRFSDKHTALELELANFRTDATSKLKDEVIRAETEVSRIRSEHRAELNDLTGLTTRQAKELADVQGMLSESQAAQASAAVAYRLETDKAVNAARESEQSRMSTTIADLRQKVDSFMHFRKELEARCDSYIKEIATVQEANSKHLDSVNEQHMFMTTESERLRLALSDTEDKLSKTNTERNTFEVDLRERSSKLDEAQTSSRKWHRLAEETTAKNQKLVSLVASLRKQLKESTTARAQDFNKMQARVAEVVKKEFDLLQISLKVGDTVDSSVNSSGIDSSFDES